MVGHGGVIGRAVQVGAWRGAVAVSIPVTLALLDVRVTVLDQTTTPALRIEGELPGGGDLFPVTPSDPQDGPDGAGSRAVTTRRGTSAEARGPRRRDPGHAVRASATCPPKPSQVTQRAGEVVDRIPHVRLTDFSPAHQLYSLQPVKILPGRLDRHVMTSSM